MTLKLARPPAGVRRIASSISPTDATLWPFTRHTASPSCKGVAARSGLSALSALTTTPRPTIKSPTPHSTPAAPETTNTHATSTALRRASTLCVR